MYWGESSLLTARAWQLGGSHPPGYCGYLHLIHLVQKILPFGDVLYRSNLAGGVLLAAVAGMLVVLMRALQVPLIVAVPESIGFTMSVPILNASTSAEVYSLHLCLILAVALLFLDAEASFHRACLAAFMTGLALTHHLTFVFMLPGILWLFRVRFRPFLRRRSAVLAVLIMFILGLSPYVFFPVREVTEPAIVWGNASDFKGFMTLITAGEEATGSLLSGILKPGGIADRANRIAQLSLDTLTGPGLILVIAGIFYLMRHKRAMAIFLLLGLLSITAAVLVYDSNETASFYLPGLLFLWVFSVAGLSCLIYLLKNSPSRPAHWLSYGLMALPTLILVTLIIPRAADVSLADTRLPGALVRIKSDTLPENTLIISRRSDICFQHWYLRSVEHRNRQQTIFQHLLSFRWYLSDLADEGYIHPALLTYPVEDSRSWNAAATASLVLTNRKIRWTVIMDPETVQDVLDAGAHIPGLICLPWGVLVPRDVSPLLRTLPDFEVIQYLDPVFWQSFDPDPITLQLLMTDSYRQSKFFTACGETDHRDRYYSAAEMLQQQGHLKNWW